MGPGSGGGSPRGGAGGAAEGGEGLEGVELVQRSGSMDRMAPWGGRTGPGAPDAATNLGGGGRSSSDPEGFRHPPQRARSAGSSETPLSSYATPPPPPPPPPPHPNPRPNPNPYLPPRH